MNSRSTELDIISIIKQVTVKTGPGQLNRIGDDCAVLNPGLGTDLVVTKDCMVEGIHFDLAYTRPDAIGVKLAISNLSDVGAAGATPKWGLLAMGFKGEYPIDFYKDFLTGLVSTLTHYGVSLVGGDTVSSPTGLFFCLTLIGTTSEGKWLSREGARPGDIIFSSGPVGDSFAGLLLLKGRKRGMCPYGITRFLTRKHLYPSYPHSLGKALLEAQVASSIIDSSDGLSKDLRHISERSGVACILRRSMLPISRPARFVARMYGIPPHELALKGGEDYVLIWTTPREKLQMAQELASTILGHLPYELGHIEAGNGLYIEHLNGRRHSVEECGYVHA